MLGDISKGVLESKCLKRNRKIGRKELERKAKEKWLWWFVLYFFSLFPLTSTNSETTDGGRRAGGRAPPLREFP